MASCHAICLLVGIIKNIWQIDDYDDKDGDDDLFQSERFLALFKQFQELGFSDLRIKAELVKNDLDSDKTLDSLTAWAVESSLENNRRPCSWDSYCNLSTNRLLSVVLPDDKVICMTV